MKRITVVDVKLSTYFIKLIDSCMPYQGENILEKEQSFVFFREKYA